MVAAPPNELPHRTHVLNANGEKCRVDIVPREKNPETNRTSVVAMANNLAVNASPAGLLSGVSMTSTVKG